MATKATEVKAAEVKAEVKVEAPKAEAKKEVVKKETTKKTTTKKAETAKAEPAKKAVAKKAPAKKATTAKKAVTTEIVLQFQGNETVVANVEEKVKAQFVAEGHKASTIKSITVYVKPEEYAAYYVINGEFTGRVDLF